MNYPLERLQSPYIKKAFLAEWLSAIDLLRLFFPYTKTAHADLIQERLFTLTALFLKYETESDLEVHLKLLNTRPDNSFFKRALQDKDFKTALRKAFVIGSGNYQYKLLNAWSQYKIAMHISEIRPDAHNRLKIQQLGATPFTANMPKLNTVAKATIIERWVTRRFAAELYYNFPGYRRLGLDVITRWVHQFETPQLELLFNALLAIRNDNNQFVRNKTLIVITLLIPKLEASQREQLFEPLLGMCDDHSSGVSVGARIALRVLISYLTTAESQKLYESLLEKLNDVDQTARRRAIQALTQLIPKLKITDSRRLLQPLLTKLDDPTYVGRPDALYVLEAIAALIPKLTITVRQTLFKSVLKEHAYTADWLVHVETLKIITLLIPHLESTEIQLLTRLLLTTLNRININEHHNGYYIIYPAFSSAIARLISELKTIETQPWIEALLAQLNNPESGIYSHALDAIAALIPKLTITEIRLFIQPLLAKLNDQDVSVLEHVFKTIAVLIPKLDATDIQESITPLLANLENREYFTHIDTLFAIAHLIPKLDITEVQQWIEPLLENLNDIPIPGMIRRATLKAIAALIPKLDLTTIQRLAEPLLNMLNDEIEYVRIDALTAIIVLTSKMNNEDLSGIINALTLYLNKPNQDDAVHSRILQHLNTMMLEHPERRFEFDDRNASIEVVTLIKMQEMQAMLQTPNENDTISHSNLKTILSSYQTQSWFGQWFDFLTWIFCFPARHQSQAIVALHLLLNQKKLLYTKDEIKTALSKDRYAQHRLSLFSNINEPKMPGSSTDDVICAIRQQF